MLQVEKRYDFKKELLRVHKSGRRNPDLKPTPEEFEIPDQFWIVLPENSDEVILTAARDFEDYLLTSMQISSMLVYKETEEACLSISINQDIGEAAGYMGYRIVVTEKGVTLEGFDSCGVAQGLYFLEDLMNFRRAPFLEKKITQKKALFSPRLVQSPFGMFEYNE